MKQPTSTRSASSRAHAMGTPMPWWRYGHVWLVIAGPVVVVIAGFVTLYLAIRTPDPVIDQDYYRKGLDINRSLEQKGVVPGALAPAVAARNHAATGVVPVQSDKPATPTP